jgi:hypothetical protein
MGHIGHDLTTENAASNMSALAGLRHRVIFCKSINSASVIYLCLSRAFAAFQGMAP